MEQKKLASNLARYVIRRRKELGLTQSKLAWQSGISDTRIANIEQQNWKRFNPTFQTIDKLAKALKIQPWELLKRIYEGS